jgi:hypothetical protein
MFGVYSRETISNAVSFSFHFHCKGRRGVNTDIYEVSGSGSTGNCRTLFIQSPVSIQRVPMQTSLNDHTKNFSPVLEEQPSQAGRGPQSQLSLKLSYGESLSTKPCCLKHSSLKICFLSDFSHFFFHNGSLPSPAKLIDCVLYQHPPLIFMSSGKLHPFHLHSYWGLFMHPLLLQLKHLSPNWEGSFNSSGSPAYLLTVGAVRKATLSALSFHS